MSQASELCEHIMKGDLDGLKQLVEQKKYDVNSCDYDFRTPLHIASAYNNLEMVEYLISKGAKNQLDRFGSLPTFDSTDFRVRNKLEKQKYNVNEVLPPHQYSTQMMKVVELIVNTGNYSYPLVMNEVYNFYYNYGLDEYYFETNSPLHISKHINGMIAGKFLAQISKEKSSLYFKIESPNSLFICSSDANVSKVFKELNTFLNSDVNILKQFYISSLRTRHSVMEGESLHANLIIVELFPLPGGKLNSGDINYICNENMLMKFEKRGILDEMSDILRDGHNLNGPKIFHYNRKGFDVVYLHLKSGLRPTADKHSGDQLLQYMYHLCGSLELEVDKVYSSSFANDSTVYTIYINNADQAKIKTFNAQLKSVALLPYQNYYLPACINKELSINETTYLVAATNIAYYFWSLKSAHLNDLYSELKEDIRYKNGIDALREEVIKRPHFTSVHELILTDKRIAKQLYQDFNACLNSKTEVANAELLESIMALPNPEQKHVYRKIYDFNRSVMATNVRMANRSSNSYRLDPSKLLDNSVYPETPYGMYFVQGAMFRGFHVRFRDISRGGIRIVKSNDSTYANNRHNLLKECYNLGYTQKLKNKDIAENGSKGVINVYNGFDYMDKECFMGFIDGIVDIMKNEQDCVYKLDREEILFLGPDENTADKMDLACLISKDRDYRYYKAFTTGKSPKLGGVPHDTYGMTTRSVRQYVTGIYRHLGLDQSNVTKIITGGPEGDLGSNEILMGDEKIIAIVDGSGVLYDPLGLDKTELDRLATTRSTALQYHSPLSDSGYKVSVNDKNITLANGETVISGENFRNTFIMRKDVSADILVPCGGRPESINPYNYHKLFREDGSPRFKYIVEGANLFISESVRPRLQDRGVLMFKDASTNKGGVTSSSMEVLASLSVDRKEFEEHFVVKPDGTIPEIYAKYVEEIIQRVEDNARLEFELVYKEIKAGKYSNEATNHVSLVMNDLFDVIQESDLYNDIALRESVLKDYMPDLLMKLYGFESLDKNLPEGYKRTAFSVWLSSRFVYKYGTN